ncbi:MAG: hypothetical protein APF76_13555 [Desulfitibacter sp. BRH_c19]|nr:MAG: hypothetical protein APF76_13555 [Desulfitibacter sp. BRH_c19]
MSQKKQEFMKRKNKKTGGNRVVIGVLIVLIVFAVGAYIKMSGDAPSEVRWEGGDYNFGQAVDYSGKILTQESIELTVEDGKAIIPLDYVTENEFIYTEYDKDDFSLPLMSYISPTGRLVTAISFCEPCRSQSFHIKGEEIICDSCNTKWDLATLDGISGGCLNYPPEEIDYQVDDGNIVISENDIRSWIPRD